MKNWFFQDLDESFAKEVDIIAEGAQLSPQFTRILLKRLLRLYPELTQKDLKKNKKEIFARIEDFLNPSLQKLLNPKFLPDVEKASQRIFHAISNNEKILIWGDYDVDGITSTALCIDFLKKHNYTAIAYLPRREEGYGLNTTKLQEFIDDGLDLLITVDCGISEYEVIEFANSKNIDCIITDHHLPPEVLPKAYAIINPCLCKEDSTYALKDIALCGVGVAFFLMCEVNTLLSANTGTKLDMRDFLDLVALGTIADMVQLRGLNRIFVRNGLIKIAESKRIGIQALKEIAGYKGAKLSAGQVSFGLAPRINAAGRMDSPDIALKMLLSENYEEALKLATELDGWNSARKAEEEEMVQSASNQANEYMHDFSLLLVDTAWNQGIVGIVASRMVEKFYKPSFVFTQDSTNPEALKGSGRSTAEIDLHDALVHCKEDLLAFGGHKKAAGLSILKENLDSFRQNLNAYVAEKLNNTPANPSIYIDEEFTFAHSAEPLFLKEIALLEPFGIGNAEPNFKTSMVLIKSLNYFGFGKKHLNIEFVDTIANQALRAKLWNVLDFPYKEGDICEISYSLELDNSSGITQVSMKLKDYRQAH